jgi:putative serine protease PepD
MTDWTPDDHDSDDTRRLPDAAGTRHRYGDPEQPRSPYAQSADRADQPDRQDTAHFGGLGFRGDDPRDPVQPARRSGRPGRGVVAGILAAALVVGGLGGLAGAAGLGLVDDRDGAGTTTAPATRTPSSPVVNQDNQKDGAPANAVERVAKSVLPSVVKINVAGAEGEGSGSGIVISADGEILTNNHVASVAGQGGTMTVNFNDGSAKKATIVGTDPVTDLAVIKAQGVSGLQPATIGTSEAIDVGENVVAIGSPFGLEATVTSGIVSAVNRPVSVQSSDGTAPQGGQGGQGSPDTTYPAIQTDAAINPGNSGGPLVDLNGAVVGINSSIRTASDGSESSSGSIGLGFAIPVATVWPVVEQLRKGETPTHAKMGVSVANASSNGGLLTGAGVQAVNGGSAAAQAGLKKGDVITKVDGQVITGSESLVATVRGHRPGDTVTLTVVRGGSDTRTVKIRLDSDEGPTNS